MRNLTVAQVRDIVHALNAAKAGPVELLDLRDVYDALMSVVDGPVRGQTLPVPELPSDASIGELEEVLDSMLVGFERNLEAAFHGMTAYSMPLPSDDAVDLAIRSWMQKVYQETAKRTEFDLVDLLDSITDEIAAHGAKRRAGN
jgi:hypothetical protein